MICPFCDNIDVNHRLIYKDNLVTAFPGNMPITPGHTLVCPVRHAAQIDDLSDKELRAIKDFIAKLKKGLIKSFNAEGFNIAWNEGVMAGQSVAHLHIHVVPRKVGDTGIYRYEPREFLYRPGVRDKSPEQELQEVAELIKRNLD